VYPIDAGRIARAAGLAGRTNTVLQTCFFAISGVLPREAAIAKIKAAIAKTYGRRGAEVVARCRPADQRPGGLPGSTGPRSRDLGHLPAGGPPCTGP
jgi:pyruvate-ferredoxin/flavodoxin oxidoreductase